MPTPKPVFEEPDINSDFRRRLKRQFITAAQAAAHSPSAVPWSWRVLLPAATVAILLVVVIPLWSHPNTGPKDDLSRLDTTLAQVQISLRADIALAQESSPAEIQAREVDETLTAYINQVSHIIILLERLIERLESTGHDANEAHTQLLQAKAQLAEAEAKAQQPVDCLQSAISDTPESPASAHEQCQIPLAEAQDSLGQVVGTLRTSVTSAKEAL